MVHNAVSFGIGKELVTEPDKPSGGNLKLQPHIAGHFMHVDQLGLAGSQIFHDNAHEILRHINSQRFHGFHGMSVFIFAQDDLRLADLHFKAFPAHRLNQNGQMQFAAAFYDKGVGVLCFLHAHGHVGLNLFHQTVPQMTAGYILALFAGKGTVVH